MQVGKEAATANTAIYTLFIDSSLHDRFRAETRSADRTVDNQGRDTALLGRWLEQFSGAAGGVVCGACEAGAFPMAPDAHAFLCEAVARPLAETPPASPRALRQAERAIAETVEHHAGVRLRAAG